MKVPADDEIAAHWAEVKGRRERTIEWELREARSREVLPDDPCRYMLIAKRLYGSGSRACAEQVTEADIRALKELCNSMLNGWSLPLTSKLPAQE